jgi:DNA polymerase-3 subunit delta'
MLDNIDKMLFSGIISHSYIFTGPEEVTSEKALFFAQKTNCERAIHSPCGFCVSCRKIQKGVNPDVFEVFPYGSSIKIDQVRDVISSFAKPPLEAFYRVCIFHESHKMTLQAQNALLKTLEEPLTKSIAILLVDNIQKLIPTVISRCQVYDFGFGSICTKLLPETRTKLAGILYNVLQGKFDVELAIKEIENTEQKAESILEYFLSLYRDVMAVKTKSKAAIINTEQKEEINSIAKAVRLSTIISALQLILFQLKVAKGRGNANLIWHNLLLGLTEVVKDGHGSRSAI